MVITWPVLTERHNSLRGTGQVSSRRLGKKGELTDWKSPSQCDIYSPTTDNQVGDSRVNRFALY